MTNIEELIQQWISSREGLIGELALVPEDKMDFRATPETRSVAELVRHAMETERSIVYQMCQDEFAPFTKPAAEMLALCIPYSREAATKEQLVGALRRSIQESAAQIRAYDPGKLQTVIRRFDGKPTTKYAMLWFSLAHEMYHRGQLALFLRLLGTEPGLTRMFKQLKKD